MNRLLQRYSHNVIVDQILFWLANRREINQITPEPMCLEGSRVLVNFNDGDTESIKIQPGFFQESWDEARIVLDTATSIPGDFRPLTNAELDNIEPARRSFAVENAERLRQRVARELAQSLIEVDELFKAGLYDMFLDETGLAIKARSKILQAKIAYALKHQRGE
jgi:hypothetical protein